MNDKEGKEVIPDSQRSREVDVVIIDDDESIREGCRQTLEGEGYRVATAANGTHGLGIVEELRPNVVVIDLKMPGISGLDVLSRISEIDSDIVTIATSGYGVIDSETESKRLGAYDFLAKPFDPEKLINTVKKGIEWKRFTT